MLLQSIAFSAQNECTIYMSETREVSGLSPAKLGRLNDNMPNEMKMLDCLIVHV